MKKILLPIILIFALSQSFSQTILKEFTADTSLGFVNKLYHDANKNRIYFKSNFNWEENILCFDNDLNLNWHTSVGDNQTYDNEPAKTIPLIDGDIIANL